MATHNGFSELVILMHKNSEDEETLKQVLESKYAAVELVDYIQNPEPLVSRAAISALGFIGDTEVVPVLVDTLKCDDSRTRLIAENALWNIWSRSGDASVDQMLNAGKMLLRNEKYVQAAEQFTAVIEAAPNFAEGYNQRAIAYFMLEEWHNALQDCKRTIARNPHHFGAFAGMGHVYLKLGRINEAIEAYKQALIVNPNLISIAEAILQLRSELQRE